MPVIIDTGGMIYNKLNVINTTLTTVISDISLLQTSDNQILADLNTIQISIEEIIEQLATDYQNLTIELESIDDTLAVMAPQLLALYNLLIKTPYTIGVDITGVVTQPKNLPTKSGP
jgi:hypothetical protein